MILYMAEVGLSLDGRKVTLSMTAAGDPIEPVESVEGFRFRVNDGGLERTNVRSGGHCRGGCWFQEVMIAVSMEVSGIGSERV